MFYFDFHHHQPCKNGIYNLNLFETPPNSPFSIGIHPKDIDGNFSEKMKWLEDYSLSENCVAIGECGLDALLETPLEQQEEAFLEQIKWAERLKKPVIIHCVRRFNEILKFRNKTSIPLIIHGFNRNKNIAQSLLNTGFYLSFGKASLYNLSLQEILKSIPLDRFFLETDDSSVEIGEIYTKVSEIKNISTEQLQQQILKNINNITHS